VRAKEKNLGNPKLKRFEHPEAAYFLLSQKITGSGRAKCGRKQRISAIYPSTEST
jgi:hypothetical protein